jgi:murein DD-endopeptidase MepM/ murein hydrolase activator NlpD
MGVNFRRASALFVMLSLALSSATLSRGLFSGSEAPSAPNTDSTITTVREGLETIPLQLSSTPKTIVLSKKRASNHPAFVYHRVVPGDTLTGIASRYDVSAKDVKLASNMTGNTLHPGELLRVPVGQPAVVRESRLPPGVRVYTVRRGETLSRIEQRFNVTRLELISANPGILSMDRLASGTDLFVPTTQKGLVLRLAPGQTLVDLASSYGVPLTTMVSVNGLGDPREVATGDYVIIPGVRASSTLQRLEAKRAVEAVAAEKARAEAEAKRRAALEAARKQRDERAKLEAAQATRRDALRARQRAGIARVQRAAVYTRPVRDAGDGGYAWPMRSFQITSGYGYRNFWIGKSNFHSGVDLAASVGTPIYAARSGTVFDASYSYVDFGLHVRVAAGDGVVNIYGHMSRLAVASGQFVSRGELIGFVGCTGICSGPHLHFEVQVDGRHRNPMRYLP